MAVNFPSNPTNGQTITVSGITYAYDSTQGVWSDSPQGLTQAIDALTDVDTSTVAPTNGQVLQWNSTDSEWQPADSSAGVTVYATIDDLPLSGVTEGSMALVDSTDKLYIFSDSGWYSISIVNTTPSISGVSATYTLATDGTATVVTVTATDPEGIPITYSIVSDTSGNVATVTQGTGANTNQWTITPSTNTANAGNFTLVFRASDGVNIASASSTFELRFTVEKSNYTTALITPADNGYTSNKVFRDSSGNNHTITANGDATQNTFSPYRHGGYSVLLDSNAAYLRTPTDARYDIGGTGDWSYEAWVYVPTSHTFASYARAFGMGPFYNNSKSFGVFLSDADSSDKMAAYWHDGSIGRKLTSTTAFDKGKWNHIAVCRTGNDIALYYNGTRIAHNSSYTASISTGNTYLFSGGTGNGTEGFNGYIRDVHFVNGSHDYDASSASLTVPTEKISAISNTKYLGSQEPYINDNSTHDVAITTSGTVTTEPFGPYDYGGYSASTHAGSAYFDGSGDYLKAIDHANFDMGTGKFTIELWMYADSQSTSYPALVSSSNYNSAGSSSLRFDVTGQNDKLFLYCNSASPSADPLLTSSSTLSLNQWHHVALVRDGTSLKFYVDGTENGSVTIGAGQTFDFSVGELRVGRGFDVDGANAYFTGHISDLRIVKGTAVYTSAFPPPTAPLTAITNTSLLLPFDDATIIDKSQTCKNIEVFGNTTVSTSQTKYGSYSMYFDGSGDYLKIQNHDFIPLRNSGNDFTIEFWIYLNNISAEQNIVETVPHGATTGWTVYVLGTSGRLDMYPNHTNMSTLSASTWYHVAIENYGGTLKCFINGTSTYSATMIASSSASTFIIGSRSGTGNYLNGYIEDLRFTNGYARYQGANFSAPSAALEG